MKDQIKDLASAIKEEGMTSLLESGVLTPLVIELANQLTTDQASLLVGSMFGALAPRMNGVILSYKQNRFERNITALVTALTSRVEVLENNYTSLSPEMQEQYRTEYVEMLLDNIVDERQEEKIKWNVNGFINLMTEDSNENTMQIFFDTLSELTVLDVDVLRMFDYFSSENWRNVSEKYGLGFEQYRLVKEKLVRFGLLSRNSDNIRDGNIDAIVELLQSKKQNPKLPSSVKKVVSNDSYSITSLGTGFLRSISE